MNLLVHCHLDFGKFCTIEIELHRVLLCKTGTGIFVRYDETHVDVDILRIVRSVITELHICIFLVVA